jgi:hypothetical protein
MMLTLKKIAYAASCAGTLALAGLGMAHAQGAAHTAGATVRGTVQSVDAKSLHVSTASGVVDLAIHASLTVYSSQPSDLAHVKSATFVGVTSVKQANGSELAKEIHIFPEALRGTGEGSHMMDAGNGNAPAAGSRMTNGNVSSTQMMKSSASASRMTNGTVQHADGTGKHMTLTVNYAGGSQIIAVPANVTVTMIAQTQEPLTPGARVYVMAQKDASGALVADRVMLANRPAVKQ